jgi:hypothetical protein
MEHPPQSERELMDLLSAAWDGHLDEPSREKLEQLLAQNDFAGVPLLLEFSRIHVDLEWIVSSGSAQRKGTAAVARAKVESGRFPVKRLLSNSTFRAAAALLLVALTGWGLRSLTVAFRGPSQHGELAGTPMARPPVPVGRVAFGAGVIWATGHELRDGQRLLEGQVVDLVEGTVQVSMEIGAEIAIDAPCRMTLVGSELVKLESGVIGVRAAEWVDEFNVQTNDLLVTDIGTRFVVDADARFGSAVHVFEGLVIATPLKHPTANRRVGTREAVQMTAEGQLESVPFRRGPLVERLDSFRPLRSIAIPPTGLGRQVGNEDPKWRITAGDDDFGPYPRPAVISNVGPRHGLNEPARSQWISVADGMTRGAPVRTKYTYETTFDLNGYDPRSVRLTGLILADNGVEEIRINGQLLPVAPWLDWFAGVTFFKFHSIDIESGFVPGKNTLSISVINETDLPPVDKDVEIPETPNPMGLRVEWQASGRPL